MTNFQLRKKYFLKSIPYLLLGILVLMLGLPAQAAIVPDCNPVPGYDDSCTVGHLFQLLVNIYNFLLGMAAIVTLLFLIYSGIRMFYFSFLEDSAGELSAAKLGITRAITGLVLVAIAYLLVNTVVFLLTGGEHDLASFFYGVLGIDAVT